ncbi:MAG: hypothetical protein ACAI25_19875 [Planctomycetota bacterium]
MTPRTRAMLVAVVAMVSVGGCSASFEHRTKEHESPVLARKVRVGIHYSIYIAESFRAAGARAFAGDKSIEAMNAEKVSGPFDEEIRIDTHREVRKRPENFFISWPGFLIFAPCWFEFRWKYVLRTRISVRQTDGEPIVVEAVDKYSCAYTPVLDGVQAELGFITWSSLALFEGLHKALEDPNPVAFDEDFIKKEGESWSRTLVALTHQALAKAERQRASRAGEPTGSSTRSATARNAVGEKSSPMCPR